MRLMFKHELGRKELNVRVSNLEKDREEERVKMMREKDEGRARERENQCLHLLVQVREKARD